MRQRDATKGIRACQGLGNVFLFGEGRGNDSQQRIRNRSSPSDVLSKARDVSVE